MSESPAALFRNPTPRPGAPAQTLARAIPSHRHNLNALLYTAVVRGLIQRSCCSTASPVTNRISAWRRACGVPDEPF
jgi:hypothetical protein